MRGHRDRRDKNSQVGPGVYLWWSFRLVPGDAGVPAPCALFLACFPACRRYWRPASPRIW
jgi:hypothetical protein